MDSTKLHKLFVIQFSIQKESCNEDDLDPSRLLPSRQQPHILQRPGKPGLRENENFEKNTFPYQISTLQAPPAPPAPPAQPARPASPAPTGEAQAYCVIFIPNYGCNRLAEQLLGQKLKVFVSSEFL